MSGQNPFGRFIREAAPALVLYALVILILLSLSEGVKLIDLIQSTGFLLAALLAAYFAWLNLEGARRKRCDDLFDKRFALYESLINLYYLSFDQEDGSLPPDTEGIIEEIYRLRYKAKFIFGDDVHDHCLIMIERIQGKEGDAEDIFDPHAPFTKYLILEP